MKTLEHGLAHHLFIGLERLPFFTLFSPILTATLLPLPIMKKIEHLGIAVQHLEESILLYERLLNTSCYKRELVEQQGLETAFFQTGPNKIELLASTDPQGVIARFLEKRGEGIHHIAFEVDDIEAEMKRLSEEGFTLLQEKPIPGADNKLICFVHPKNTHGVLIELCMERQNIPG
jgi:methylmalonyl-CoA/ethylmalonyl-CoA epimerase